MKKMIVLTNKCTCRPFASGGAIINREDGNCLHVDGDADIPNDYTNVITTGCNESNNQKWAFDGSGQLIHTPSGKCLDMGKPHACTL